MTIKADSIDTNNAERDTHLKGPDFFDVAVVPRHHVRKHDRRAR